MTREEAIEMLKSKMDGHTDTSYEWAETVRMAIKALEKESIYDDKEHYVTISKALYDKLNIDYEALSQEPCDDAISREAVIQTLNRMDRYTATELTLCDTDKKFPANEVFIVDDVYEQIAEHLPSVTQKSGWIPVSERLPKAGEYVGNVEKYYLVQNEYGDMLVARYTHSEYWEQIYQLKPVADEIVAWMPLPEPFESQESEDKE